MLEESCQASIWDGIVNAAKTFDIDLVTFPAGTIEGDGVRTHYDLIDTYVTPSLFDAVVLFTGALTEYTPLDTIMTYITNAVLPITSISSQIPCHASIMVDNREGIIKQVKHLVKSHNKKRIVFIKGPNTNEEAQQRFEAYREGLKRVALPFLQELIYEGDFSEEAGADAVNNLIEHNISFDAIIGADDYTIMGALKALKKHEIYVPEKIALVGFDDVEEGTMITPSLSTIRQPFYQLGYRALEAACNEKYDNTLITVDTPVVHRDSCGCVPEEVQLFRDHLTEAENQDIPHNAPDDFLAFMQPLIIYLVEQLDSPDPKITNQYSAFLEESISEIFTLFSKAIIDTEYKDTFLSHLIAIISHSEDFHHNLSIWKHIITLVLPRFSEVDDLLILKRLYHLQQEARILLDEYETKYVRHMAYNKQEVTFAIRESCEHIITCTDREKLFSVISEQLMECDVTDAVLVLFNNYAPIKYNDWKQPKELITQLIIQDGEPLEMQRGFSDFAGEKLFPEIFYKSFKSNNFVFLSLCFNDEYFGYLLMNIVPTAPKELYEELRIHISSALKSCFMLDNLKALSMNDELTGLSNRRGYMLLAQQLHAKALNSGIDLLIFYFDMDGLKHINDTFGHDAGDHAIKGAATLLQRTFRNNDIIGRIGGDEFTTIVECTADGLEEIITGRLRTLIDTYNDHSKYPYTVDMSIGFCKLSIAKNHTIEETLCEADRRMMENKRMRKKERKS